MPVSVHDRATEKAEKAEKARQYARGQSRVITATIRKAENLADTRTGGRYHNQLARTSDQALAYLDGQPAHASVARINSPEGSRVMTATEPTVNDLSPILAPGVENEPMLLLDTTGSMSYPVAEGASVQRRQVVGEAIGRIVEVLGAQDSQAAKEQASGDDAGGLMTVTFAGRIRHLYRGSESDELEREVERDPLGWRHPDPAWLGDARRYLHERVRRPAEAGPPHLLALVITDGEADDTTEFAAALQQAKSGTYVCVAVLGIGNEHDAALTAYRRMAATNDQLRVVSFGSETDPTVIADGLLSLLG